MARLALIITSDKSLAKFVGESLTQYGYDFEIASEKLHVPAQLRRIRPELVICDRDISGINSLLLCKTLKESAPIGFAILIQQKPQDKIATEMKEAGIDQVLIKPTNKKHFDDFEKGRISHDLQQLRTELEAFIKNFIANRTKSAKNDILFLLLLSDTLTRCVFIRLLSNMGARTITCDTVYEAMVYLDNSEGRILLTSPDNIAEITALAPPSLTNLVLLNGDNAMSSRDNLQIHHIKYPGTIEDISQELLKCTNNLYLEENTKEALEFSSNEISLLAARISAAVYEKLLLSPSLQHGHWGESAKLVRNEVLTTCNSLEASLRRKHSREKP